MMLQSSKMAAAAADAESPAPPPPLAAEEEDTSGPAPRGARTWPDFAVVCSFLERYGAMLDLPELSFPELEEALEETGAVAKPLMEIHLKLMRKIGKSVTYDRWEKYLVKVCQDYNRTWAWELEKKGYLEMSVECKVGMLKHLCECQFDDNLKFKNIINEEDGDAMRLQPIGRDKDGLMYWLQLDQDHNVRMYIEEQDDQDGSTWKCIVRTRNDLAESLELLKAQIDPALLKKCEENSSRESPNPDDEAKKENEEKSAEDGEVVKPDPEDGSCKTKSTVLKTSSEIKTEPISDADDQNPAVKDEKDSFKENVKPLKVDEKTEPKDTKGNAEQIPPSQEPERSEISVIVKRTEDPVEKSLEETEKIKNDHQAKIPLKKRELKLTEDFDNSVKTSLGKPGTPTKEVLLKYEGKPEEDNLKTSVGIAANTDGKQLVNGEVNREKEAHKTKADQVENSNTRESVLVSTKDENGLLNEKRSTGVIKSLMAAKESKITNRDSSEKNIKSLGSGDVALSTEESSPKPPPVIQELGEVNLKNAARTEVEDVKGQEKGLTVTDGKGKKTSDKEGSIKEVGDCKPAVVDKPAEVSTDDSKAMKDVPPSKTDESNEGKAVASVKQTVDAEKEGKVESREKAGDNLGTEKGTAVKTVKSKVSKHSVSMSNLDGPIELKKNAEDETAQQEKSSEPEKKTKALKTRQKEKPVPKKNTTSTSSKSLPAKGDVADKEEKKSSKTEKQGQGPTPRNRHQNKIAEEENNGPECKEMTSERQKDGLKLTIRISNKRKRSELPQQTSIVDYAEEAEAEENSVRTLRRSPRISRPSAKIVEIKERKPEKRQSDDEEEEEEEAAKEEKPAPSKPEKEEERKADKAQCPKVKKKPKQRRRARWTNFRSRRRRKESSEEESEETDSEADSQEGSEVEENKEEGVPGEDDEPCKKCGLPNHPELILLCDSCDSGYHTACLRPPLMLIPDGEWFCPPCQHKLLCDKLEEQLQNLDVVLKKKERAERRKERLVYVGISIENIIPTQDPEEVTEVVEKEEKKKKKPKPLERRSTRTRKCISYRFDEFDEAIDEAIEEDIRDGEGGGGAGRGKDMSNITGLRGKDISTIIEAEKTEGKRPQRAVTRRKKRRRLNDLDSDSNVDDEESEDEFRISDGSEDEFVISDENAAESDEDQQSNDSDFGARKPRRHYRRPVRKSRRLKRRSTRRRYSDDDEDESDEADESESEGSSDYSDDYLETRRRRSRRNQKRQVNYREDSESDSTQKRGRYGRGKEMRRVVKRRFSSSDSSDDSADERPQTERKHLVRKRIRSSNDEASEEEAEKPPVRKRPNRIDTDDDDDEEEGDAKDSTSEKPPVAEKPVEEKPVAEKPVEEKPVVEKPVAEKPVAEKPVATSMLQESTKKPYRIESDDDDDFDNVGKDGSPLDYSLVDLPSTNGQSPGKTIENLIGKPNEKSQNSKDGSASVGQASNGMGNNQEAAVPEEDEDELLRVTDLVDYVCNSEQL